MAILPLTFKYLILLYIYIYPSFGVFGPFSGPFAGPAPCGVHPGHLPGPSGPLLPLLRLSSDKNRTSDHRSAELGARDQSPDHHCDGQTLPKSGQMGRKNSAVPGDIQGQGPGGRGQSGGGQQQPKDYDRPRKNEKMAEQ